MQFRKSLGVAAAAAAMSAAAPASATEILFGFVGGGYFSDGNAIAGYANALSGVNVTTRRFDTEYVNDFSNYDQIWVYDLTTGANNNANQMLNYQGVADWFNAQTEKNMIADGRIISSASSWTGRPPQNDPSGEPAWIQNYAVQLDQRGGGLVLGTDHANFNQDTGVFVDGINTINDLIGIGRFNSFYYEFPYESLVDKNSPLYIPTLDACTTVPGEQCINDNSSTSIAPSGQQSNGIFLTPVAYHVGTDNAYETTSVSATFGSITFGTCGDPGEPPCTPPTDVAEAAPIGLMGLGVLGLGFAATRRRRA